MIHPFLGRGSCSHTHEKPLGKGAAWKLKLTPLCACKSPTPEDMRAEPLTITESSLHSGVSERPTECETHQYVGDLAQDGYPWRVPSSVSVQVVLRHFVAHPVTADAQNPRRFGLISPGALESVRQQLALVIFKRDRRVSSKRGRR